MGNRDDVAYTITHIEHTVFIEITKVTCTEPSVREKGLCVCLESFSEHYTNVAQKKTCRNSRTDSGHRYFLQRLGDLMSNSPG